MWPDLELIGLYPLRFSEIRARNYIPVPNTTSPILKKGITDTDFSTCLLESEKAQNSKTANLPYFFDAELRTEEADVGQWPPYQLV